MGADRDFRSLLRNGCLSSLREVDYELEYLARCQASKIVQDCVTNYAASTRHNTTLR